MKPVPLFASRGREATKLPHNTLLDLAPSRRVPKKSSRLAQFLAATNEGGVSELLGNRGVDMQWVARVTSGGPKGYSTLPAQSPGGVKSTWTCNN